MPARLSLLLAGTLVLVGCQKAEQSAGPALPTPPADQPIQIPQVADAAGDWAKQAHRVLALAPLNSLPGGRAQLALAWTPSALLLQVTSHDTTSIEAANEDLWTGDSLDVFVESSPGSEDRIQFLFSAGRTPDQPKPRCRYYVKSAPTVVPPEMKAESTDKGYVLTMAIPWANLKHPPKAGDVIGVQVYVNDVLGPGKISYSGWYPSREAGSDPNQVQHVQLSAQADPPEAAATQLRPEGFSGFTMEVLATPGSEGKSVELRSGDKTVARGQLEGNGPRGDSSTSIPIPPDLARQKDTPLRVAVAGRFLPATFHVPDLTALRQKVLKDQLITAAPAIFDGPHFPKIDYLNHDLIEAALGPYTLSTRFFDGKFNEVTEAATPGRYGALIDVTLPDGTTCERELTLFKTPKPYLPTKDPYQVTVKFPDAFGFPAIAANAEGWNISDWGDGLLQKATRYQPDGAVLAAAMSDLIADPARWHGFSAQRIEGDWWYELEHRLGKAQDYHYVIRLPEGYDKEPDKKWPLLVFLHSSAQRGSDLKWAEREGPFVYLNQGHSLPFIILAPQCPAGERWVPAPLNAMIDKVIATHRVDPKRIYLTGQSMGAYGTYDLAGEYPDKFAAIAPFAGGENNGIAQRLIKTPTWIFQGAEDPSVPPRYSIDIAEEMKRRQGPVKLTLIPGMGHDGWDAYYAKPDLYDWFLQQHQN